MSRAAGSHAPPDHGRGASSTLLTFKMGGQSLQGAEQFLARWPEVRTVKEGRIIYVPFQLPSPFSSLVPFQLPSPFSSLLHRPAAGDLLDNRCGGGRRNGFVSQGKVCGRGSGICKLWRGGRLCAWGGGIGGFVSRALGFTTKARRASCVCNPGASGLVSGPWFVVSSWVRCPLVSGRATRSIFWTGQAFVHRYQRRHDGMGGRGDFRLAVGD